MHNLSAALTNYCCCCCIFCCTLEERRKRTITTSTATGHLNIQWQANFIWQHDDGGGKKNANEINLGVDEE